MGNVATIRWTAKLAVFRETAATAWLISCECWSRPQDWLGFWAGGAGARIPRFEAWGGPCALSGFGVSIHTTFMSLSPQFKDRRL